jgi:hypothetical protein
MKRRKMALAYPKCSQSIPLMAFPVNIPIQKVVAETPLTRPHFEGGVASIIRV